MPGQPTPPILVEAFAANAPACTPEAPVAGGKTSPFPTPSQQDVLQGVASLNDGFPPLAMTAPTDGGVAPFGVDFNGIMYLVSAWAAFLAAGQVPTYDATLAADMGGYAKGAILQQTADATALWVNLTAGNEANPDTGGAGWISSKPLYAAAALVAGDNNNYALPGPSDYVLALSAAAGNASITGIVAQRDGQRVTIQRSDASANTLTITSLDAGSAAANQLQIVSAGLALPLQYASLTFQYSSTLGYWVQV